MLTSGHNYSHYVFRFYYIMYSVTINSTHMLYSCTIRVTHQLPILSEIRDNLLFNKKVKRKVHFRLFSVVIMYSVLTINHVNYFTIIMVSI
jgi:hypothetical protein